jgi:hypothetical protein
MFPVSVPVDAQRRNLSDAREKESKPAGGSIFGIGGRRSDLHYKFRPTMYEAALKVENHG